MTQCKNTLPLKKKTEYKTQYSLQTQQILEGRKQATKDKDIAAFAEKDKQFRKS